MDERVDAALRSAGAEWRSRQTPPRVDPRVVLFTPRRRISSFGLAGTTLGLAATAVAVLALATSLPLLGAPVATGEPDDRFGELLAHGASVEARGSLVVRPFEAAKICRPGLRFSVLGPRGEIRCTPRAVPVLNVDVSDVPGWEGVSADDVVVRGTWNGTAIDVESVRLPDPDPTVSAPCPRPPAGWPEPSLRDEALEAALADVNEIIEADLGHYGGMWHATDNGHRLLVVGTVRPPAEVQEQLEGVYPDALCVTRVPNDLDTLRRVAQELSTPDQAWSAEVSPEFNRVAVSFTALTPASVARLVPYAGIVRPDPLVRVVESPAQGDR